MTKNYIYSITSLDNGKKYVGQTKNLASRMANHMMADTEIGKLFREDFFNMEIKVLEILEDVNEREIATAEQRWIDEFDCVENGYNKIPARSKNITTTIKNFIPPQKFVNQKLGTKEREELMDYYNSLTKGSDISWRKFRNEMTKKGLYELTDFKKSGKRFTKLTLKQTDA